MTIAVLTKFGWRIDGKGRTVKQAYRDAKRNYEAMWNPISKMAIAGDITPYFFFYDKDGFADIYTPTYDIRTYKGIAP